MTGFMYLLNEENVHSSKGRGPNYEPLNGGSGQEGLIEVDVRVEQLKLIPICQRSEIDD